MHAIPMQPWHLMSVALRMRECDIEQMRALGVERDPQVWACRQVLRGGSAFAIVNAEGMPLACVGAVCEDDIADVWFAAIDAFTTSPKAQAACARTVRAFVTHGQYTRLRATCSTRHPYASRTLDALGFERRGSCAAFARDGGDLLHYAIDIEHAKNERAA